MLSTGLSTSHSSPPSEHNHPEQISRNEDFVYLRSSPIIYVGRFGGNQEFTLDPSDPAAQAMIEKTPDAVPWMPVRALLSLRGFKEPTLWRSAIMEGFGAMLLAFTTILLGSGPPLNVMPLPVPDGPEMVFGTALFIGASVGSAVNVVFLALFIYTFGVLTGGHLNSLITFGTFCVGLTTLPRMVLYIGFQCAGSIISGLLVRASLNSSQWKAGGCYSDPRLVTTAQAFITELMASLTILTLAFGVGLDPRQASTFGPALSPILVGLLIGAMTLCTAYAIPGYGGAGTNPNRCLGVWVGSGGSLGVTAASTAYGYDGSNGDRLWIYWVAPSAAYVLHAMLYHIFPPWTMDGRGNLEIKRSVPRISQAKTTV